ncbi:MAG: radical SAM family heme chaperone HemW [Pseudomonadota bacterium]
MRDATEDFGVYVHWPFCAAKCPYCDFNSHVRLGGVDEAAFCSAYSKEIEHMAARSPGRTVTSIFFGGGTPSLMSPESVAHILDAVQSNWSVADDAEVTLEANPTSADAGRFAGYRQAGVNRVSLGVQSLNDDVLKFLGRLHSVEQARSAVEMARETFPRLSFDLIYARPDQTEQDWCAELEDAIRMSADHLSLYQLTIEEGTPFFDLQSSGKRMALDPDQAAHLYEVTQEITQKHGLPAYEISNHAAPGSESRHNLTYWRYGEYAGVGPGAHGRLGPIGERRATATERLPEKWREAVENQGHGLVTDEVLDEEALGDEMLVMGLRLKEGFDVERFARVSGRPLSTKRIDDLISYGFIEWVSNSRLRATSSGWLVLDAVVADLAA